MTNIIRLLVVIAVVVMQPQQEVSDMGYESIVRPTHLSRTAFIYPRQSDPKQVRENRGSHDYQLAQVEFARRLGWKDENIRLVDQDLGRSGTTTIGRASYQEMVGGLRAGRAGGIFVAAFDRAGRDEIELLILLRDCADFDTLIVEDGIPSDVSEFEQRLPKQFKALMASAEIHTIRRRMRQGILGKLAHGLAVSRPPAGYVISSKGRWAKEPDAVAQASIEAAFRTILEVRSFSKAARALREHSVQLPHRIRPRDATGNLPEVDDGVRILQWRPATKLTLLIMVKNRSYTGDYVYGRMRVDPRLGRASNGKPRKRRGAEEELHIIPNHHEPYISHAQFAELQHIININRPSAERRNMGCGRALLEGKLVRCAAHRNHATRISYQVDRHGRPRWWYYKCEGGSLDGGGACQGVPGTVLEPVVVGALLARLNTPCIEDLHAAWEAAHIAEGDDGHRHEAELARADAEVKQARRRCLAVDREKHPQVAEEYEGLWEEAKTRLNKLQSGAALPQRALSLFTTESWNEVLALTGQRQELWDAPTTTVQDKKELVRTLVRAVIMEPLGRDHVRRGRIVWQDGVADAPFELPTRESIRHRIRELTASGLHPREIAERLNQDGLKTRQGRRWSAESVAAKLRRL